MEKRKTDYILEKRLRKLDPELHRRFSDTGFVLQGILDRYGILFPEFTEHTQVHCVTVIDFCNLLIGDEQIMRMNADEIYILLMACYLHDTGMVVSSRDYESFKAEIDSSRFYRTHPDASEADFVREFHQELSGLFIRKYADLFDIPSEKHVHAIIQVSRGHRKTDLYDPVEYPSDYALHNGNLVCMPYMSALIRLADEIEVAASHNPVLLYDIEDIAENMPLLKQLESNVIKTLVTTDTSLLLYLSADMKEVPEEIEQMRKNMQRTLDYCRDLTEKRTPYLILQERVEIEYLK